MSYRETKEKLDKKSRKIKYVVLAVLIFVAAGLCIFSAFFPADTWKYYVKLPKVSARAEGELRIHFLSVGQGDCTILELPDGKTMMIDGGDGSEENTAAILRYVNALGIKRLDYLLLTHSDSDHCGGLDSVLKIKGANAVFFPGVPDGVNAEYASFYAALSESGAKATVSRRYLQIFSDDGEYPYSLTFLWPYRPENPGSPYGGADDGAYTDAELNDTSAVVWLDYFGTSALFCGDASSAVEALLMRDYGLGFFEGYGVELDGTEILKVSHHGSRSATSEEFVRFLGVETSVISCGRGNLYGHPAAEVCDVLSAAGAEIYRTDLDGNVTVAISPGGAYRTETQYRSEND